MREASREDLGWIEGKDRRLEVLYGYEWTVVFKAEVTVA